MAGSVSSEAPQVESEPHSAQWKLQVTQHAAKEASACVSSCAWRGFGVWLCVANQSWETAEKQPKGMCFYFFLISQAKLLNS